MDNEKTEVVTSPTNQNGAVATMEWFWTILVSSLPIIGLIMLFIWAFDKSGNPSKANWAKATLIWMAVGVVIMIIFFSVFLSVVSSISK